MIPKTLIYCNFGNMEFREDVEKLCIQSWADNFPNNEWKYVELNEQTFDINCNAFVKLAYKQKKYAYVADYARIKYLYENGGVYVDTDLLMLKPLSLDILSNDCFIGTTVISGYMMPGDIVSTGIIGCVKHNSFIKDVLDKFEAFSNELDDNYKFKLSNPFFMETINNLAIERGLISKKHVKANDKTVFKLNDITVYPFDYFTCVHPTTHQIYTTDKSYCMHLYGAFWTTAHYKNKCYTDLLNNLLKMEETK